MSTKSPINRRMTLTVYGVRNLRFKPAMKDWMNDG